MTRTLRSVIAVAAVFGLVAAACGGEVTDTDDGVSAPTIDAPAVEPDATEPDTSDDDADGGSDAQPTGGDTSDDASEPSDDEPAADDTDAGSTDGAADADADADEEPAGPAPNIYEDPRGGLFAEFQATMDRGDHPFMQIDQFCVAHEPAPNRVATDVGITADSINLSHIRSKLEDFAAIGFGLDVGDPEEMFETFTTVVNEQCGGIRGRMIDLHTVHVDVLGDALDEQRNAACIESIEDNDAVIVLNSSGFQGSAILCIVDDHQTAFISTQTVSEEFIARAEGRLISTSPTSEESLSWLALDLLARGELEGKVIGIAAPDTPGQYEAVESGLVNLLREGGANVAVFDKIGCGGTIACTEGAVETVARMRNVGVDVVFNVMNVISAPIFLSEMLNQGFEPGDVQFYASGFNNQADEIVAEKVVAFGGEAAGALYNGARFMEYRDTGAYRLDGYEPRAFNEMCNDTYGANSPSGTNHESEDRYDGNSSYGMTSQVCAIMRMALRAIYDAGDNPTRADIYEALVNLGAVDTNEMVPGSLRPDKTRVPDVLNNLVWEFPCTMPYPLPVTGLEAVGGTCIYPIDEFRPAPE